MDKAARMAVGSSPLIHNDEGGLWPCGSRLSGLMINGGAWLVRRQISRMKLHVMATAVIMSVTVFVTVMTMIMTVIVMMPVASIVRRCGDRGESDSRGQERRWIDRKFFRPCLPDMAHNDPWPHRRSMNQMPPSSPHRFPALIILVIQLSGGPHLANVTRLSLALATSSTLMGEDEFQIFRV